MHGGDIYRNDIELDFSVNINPFDIPQSIKDAMIDSLSKIGNYPDIKCERLKSEISNYFKISKEHIVCTNGASELIMAGCQAKRPKKALIFSPCFSGYERALDAVGCEKIYIHDFETLLSSVDNNVDIVFIGNPNNPTGQIFSSFEMECLAAICGMKKALLVIDESFAPLSNSYDEITYANNLKGHIDNTEYLKTQPKSCESEIGTDVLIVRSFTKSFAIPGIRLGYGLCSNEKLAKKIENCLPEWNVSVVAQEVGIAAMQKPHFVRNSARRIARERDFLIEQLKLQHEFNVCESGANYVLFEDLRSRERDLFNELLNKKILIRDCSSYDTLYKGWYRVAVKTREENERLIKEIKSIRRDE